MWQSVIADAAMVVGILFFVLTSLEIFLSDAQKRRVGNKLLYFWFWLSEAKRWPLLDWLRKRHRSVASISVLLASVYAAWAFRNAVIPSPAVSTIALALVIIAIGFWLGLKIVRRTLHAPSLLSAFLRASLFVVIALTPLTIISITVLIFKDTFLSLTSSFANSIAAGGQPTLGVALFALCFLGAYVFSVHLTVLALIFWAAVAVPLTLIYTLSGVLFISELIVRRTAEYPKGPILAISTFLFAVGALLKVLSSR
jgi:hypothetical protein